MSPAEEEKAEPSSSSSSAWKDVPRRLITVSLGVPSIILLLRNPITSWLFFQGAHILCLIEWGELLPTPSYSSEDINNNKDEDDATTLLLSRFMYCTFCLFSILITSISTSSALPLWLMSFGITIRLLPHFYLPTYQRQQQTNKDNQTSSQTTTTILHDIVMMQQHYQFGLLYLSLGFHYIIQISKIGGPIHIGNLLFIVWMSDTGALILGRIVKKKTKKTSNNDATTKTMNKRDNNDDDEEEDKTNEFFVSFLKSISPGKTIPGLLGGIITGPISSLIFPITLPPSTILSSFFSVEEGQCNNNEDEDCSTTTSYITAQLFNFLYNNNQTNQKILLGLLLSTSGIIGDLAESSVKRMSMKKDSGSLLPGHGGVVDRFDSLFVAAIVYYYLILA